MKKCSICPLDGYRKSGNQMLCQMHYRMRDMRSKAKQNGKAIPSRELISQMVQSVINDGLRCPHCKVKMNWLARDGRMRVLSLQHDRSGGFRILCLLCNMRHAAVRDDLFYEVKPGYRWCGKCDQILEMVKFQKSERPRGCKTYCKRCSNSISAKWKMKNRKQASEYERVRRQKKRDEKKATIK